MNDIIYTGDNTLVHKSWLFLCWCIFARVKYACSSDCLALNVCKTFTNFSHVFHGFIVNGSRIYALSKNPMLLQNNNKTDDFYQFPWNWFDIPLYHGNTLVWSDKVYLCMP